MMATTHALVAEDIAKAYGAGKIATSVLNGLSIALGFEISSAPWPK